MKCGLLPMSQEALICGNVSYHEYRGILVDAEEKEKIARNLGVHNKVSHFVLVDVGCILVFYFNAGWIFLFCYLIFYKGNLHLMIKKEFSFFKTYILLNY